MLFCKKGEGSRYLNGLSVVVYGINLHFVPPSRTGNMQHIVAGHHRIRIVNINASILHFTVIYCKFVTSLTVSNKKI